MSHTAYLSVGPPLVSVRDPPSVSRVPTQVLQSLIRSYIRFSVCKALQSLIFGIFSANRSYKVLFLLKSKFQNNENLKPCLK